MAGLLIMVACHSSYTPLQTVEQVDLNRYKGRWYDIAHLPQKFQEGCSCVTADYIPKEEFVQVINNCVKEDETTEVQGKAFPVAGSQNSKLEVQFFWPFKGDYQILALDNEYTTALVGTPDRESLWILSRSPELPASIVKQYLNKAEEMGFNTSQMVYTDQSCFIK